MNAAKLPIELFITIAEFLAEDYAYHSLAHLNLGSKAIRVATLPVLYETLMWDRGRKWWILEEGRIPDAWVHVKYLVTDSKSSTALRNYLDLVGSKRRPSYEDTLTTYFPRLVLLLTHEPNPSSSPASAIRDVHVTLHKPISISTFLEAVATAGRHANTTFFGASLNRVTPKMTGLSCTEDRITHLAMSSTGYLTSPVRPIERDHWYGRHVDEIDLTLHLETDPLGELTRIEETLDTLLPVIPLRRPGDKNLCHIMIDSGEDLTGVDLGPIGVLHALSGRIPQSLREHVRFTIPLPCNMFSTGEVQQYMEEYARFYSKEWSRLGHLAPGTTFFRTQFTDSEEIDLGLDDRYNSEDSEPEDRYDAYGYSIDGRSFDQESGPKESWMWISTLTSLSQCASRNRASGGKEDGFEFMMKQIHYGDWPEWKEEEEEVQRVLEQKIYHPS